MDIDPIYDGIVDGTRDPGDLSWTRRKLQLMALEKAKAGPADARLGALRVAAVLGPKDGLPIAQQLVRDADPRVRTWAFNQAVAARDLGLAAIRDAADGADAELALAAFDLLNRWVDQASVATARRCLQAKDARVRAAAAQLLGNIGGNAIRLDLGRLADGDGDDAVRTAASEAMRRLSGDLPKAVRTPWWDETPPTMPMPPPVGGAAPATAAPVADPTPVTDTVPAPASTDLVPVPAPDPAPEAPAAPTEPAWTGRDGRFAVLPAPLPTETRALARLLGMVAPADRPAVLDALRPLDGKALSDLLLGHTPGGDPALGRGLCLAVAGLGKTGALSKVRQLQGDAHPGVRAAAAEAVGAIGAAAAIPALSSQLDDPDPGARAAVITALADLAVRVRRPDLARDALGRLRGDLPDEVATALGAARARLGG